MSEWKIGVDDSTDSDPALFDSSVSDAVAELTGSSFSLSGSHSDMSAVISSVASTSTIASAATIPTTSSTSSASVVVPAALHDGSGPNAANSNNTTSNNNNNNNNSTSGSGDGSSSGATVVDSELQSLLEQRTLEDADAVAQSSVISLRARIEQYESDGEIQRRRFGAKLHCKNDEFLRMFVRVAKFSTERALLRLSLLQQWLDEHTTVSPQASQQQRLSAQTFRRVLEARVVQPLPGVDANGRACMLVDVRTLTDTDLLPDARAVARFAVYVAARWLRERGDVLSLRGATLLLDWRVAECGTYEMAAVKATLDALQRRIPIRLARIVVIGAPTSARVSWTLLRALLSKKLAARVYFCTASAPLLAQPAKAAADCADDGATNAPSATALAAADESAASSLIAELHAIGVDRSLLPRALIGGGTGAAAADDDKVPWVMRLVVDESRLTTLVATKPAGVARLGVRIDPDGACARVRLL
jgi:hypothetical protein